MSRRIVRKVIKRKVKRFMHNNEPWTFKFKVGDTVRIKARERSGEVFTKLHGTEQVIKDVFRGSAPYRIEGNTFLFREDELELVLASDNAIAQSAGATGCIVPFVGRTVFQTGEVDYMKIIGDGIC